MAAFRDTFIGRPGPFRKHQVQNAGFVRSVLNSSAIPAKQRRHGISATVYHIQ